jgi:hypothetical protein
MAASLKSLAIHPPIHSRDNRASSPGDKARRAYPRECAEWVEPRERSYRNAARYRALGIATSRTEEMRRFDG